MARPLRFTARPNSVLDADEVSRDYVNNGSLYARLIVNLTDVSGESPTVSIKAQGKTKSGLYYDVPSSGADLGVLELAVIEFYFLPPVWRLVYVLNGSNNPTVTFSVDVDTSA